MSLANGLELTGLHHVSSVTANAEANRDFYTRALGMRIVKKTVNQDDTRAYHLFYADKQGAPGTDVTYFDIPMSGSNHAGSGETQEVGLRVKGEAALTYWEGRFESLGIPYAERTTRAGYPALPFTGPEGDRLALIAEGDNEPVPAGEPWDQTAIPTEHAIVGLGIFTMATGRPDSTLRVLTEIMGFRVSSDTPDTDNPDNRTIVLETGLGGSGATLIVRAIPGTPLARLGRGGVHHIAFRVPTFEEHEKWTTYLNEQGMHATPVIDRFFFKSIYFREPGGVLYELATDGPGFATDEPFESMGVGLSLPPFLEDRRAEIEANLIPLDTSLELTTSEYASRVTS
ncbi:MAG: ring-cleaving dioxygenase [Thermomicrobiales bacterium]